MTTRKRLMLLGFGVFLLGLGGEASAQVSVSVQRLYPIETLFLADLSGYTSGRQPEFVSINLLNGAPSSQTVSLEVSMNRTRPSPAQIFVGSTDPFVLSEPVRRLTNRDLACADCDVGIEHGDLSEQFQDRIAQSGRFPSGSYELLVRALTPQGVELSRGSVSFEFVNPSRVELVTPGRRFGETPEILTNPTPRFIWSADAGVVSGGGQYRVRVVPVEGAASAEDAMQQFASWEVTTTATSTIYPGSVSAIPLQPGGTYAWQVVREVRSSSGTELVSSPIYWFTMAGSRGGSSASQGGAVGADNQLQLLAQSLGIDDLSGFRPAGTIYVNGQPYPSDHLEELLRAILSGEVTVNSITVR